VDGIDFFFAGKRDNPVDVEISLHGTFTGTDLVSLVGFKAVKRQAIFMRIDSHGAQAQLVGGTKDPNGDLAAVGGEKFADGTNTFGACGHSEGGRSMRKILHCFVRAERGGGCNFLMSRKEIIYAEWG
jgi:hypothetical protein